MSEGTFESHEETTEDHAADDPAIESGGEPQKKQGDPLDDVDLEPPSS